MVKSDEVIYVSSGEGATSEGEFWEAMNTASNLKLPVLFMIEDNEFAISVPVEVQTAGASVSKLVSTFPDLYVEEVDGCDPIASYDAVARAAAHCRARKGPALVHAHVIRPYSHSLSDDEGVYKSPAWMDIRDSIQAVGDAPDEKSAFKKLQALRKLTKLR